MDVWCREGLSSQTIRTLHDRTLVAIKETDYAKMYYLLDQIKQWLHSINE